jgi:SAM-dependent methyltransferase
VDRDAWIRQVRREAARRFDTLHAPTYDRDWGDLGRTHLAFVERLVGGCPPAGRVLDAACGTGKYFPTILRAGRRVIGTDQSAGMLEVARAKHPGVPTWRVGLQELAFDGEFGAVMCVDAMENVFPEDWPLVLGNLRRAMRPHAGLYLTVELPDEDALREAATRAAERGLPVVAGEQVGEGGGYHFYPSRERVAGWLDGARLAVVEEADADDYRHLLLARSPAGQPGRTS